MTCINKKCVECKKKINNKEKAAALLTYQGEKKLEGVYFHFNCYLKWLNRSVGIKAQKAVKKAFDKTIKSVPQLKNIMENMFNNGEENNIC